MIRADQAFLFFFQKGYDEAIAQCLDTLDMAPDSAELHVALGLAYQEKGDPESALRVLERAIALSPDVTIASALQAYNLGRLGETSKAQNVRWNGTRGERADAESDRSQAISPRVPAEGGEDARDSTRL